MEALLREHPRLRERAIELRRLRWSTEDLMRQLRIEAREFQRRKEAVAAAKVRSKK
jgi:hypothetical protein